MFVSLCVCDWVLTTEEQGKKDNTFLRESNMFIYFINMGIIYIFNHLGVAQSSIPLPQHNKSSPLVGWLMCHVKWSVLGRWNPIDEGCLKFYIDSVE